MGKCYDIEHPYPVLALYRESDGKMSGCDIGGCQTLERCRFNVYFDRYGTDTGYRPGKDDVEIECFTMSDGGMLLPEHWRDRV